MRPRFGQEDHGRQGQRHAAHHQKFQRIVQHRGIGTALADHRKYLYHVLFREAVCMQGLFPGQHLVHISTDRIDLAVMHDQPVWMCTIPAGHGIRGKPGMDHSDGGTIIRICQIGKKRPKLPYQEHSLVNDGPAGKRRHVCFDTALFELPADDVQPPVKIQILRQFLRTGYKYLKDPGHALPGLCAEHQRIRFHLAPSEDRHPGFSDDDLKHGSRLPHLQLILWKEKHADAVLPFFRQTDPLFRHLL